jgi:uncharacterized phage infection (PIP) family protein YhgE
MSAKIETNPTVAEQTVVLSLELGKVTNRRKINSNTEAVETEIDRKMLHLSIDLFDAPEQRQCQKFLTALKAKINLYTVPSFFRGGMYLVKVEAVEHVDILIEKAIEDFKPIVQAFADVIEQRRDESRARLKEAFDIKHYPSREQVMAGYSIDKRWMTLSTPQSLKQISASFFEREKSKAEAAIGAAYEEINKLLAAEAKELADHLIDRLTPGADGKPKVFRNSTVSNISEYLATFNLRNLGNSDDLNTQITKMRQLLQGVSPDSLRTNDTLKDSVTKSFKQVAEELDKLIIAAPTRMIDFQADAL